MALKYNPLKILSENIGRDRITLSIKIKIPAKKKIKTRGRKLSKHFKSKSKCFRIIITYYLDTKITNLIIVPQPKVK
jgi:hypothetical protein